MRACGISAPIIMLCCVVCFFYQIHILVSNTASSPLTTLSIYLLFYYFQFSQLSLLFQTQHTIPKLNTLLCFCCSSQFTPISLSEFGLHAPMVSLSVRIFTGEWTTRPQVLPWFHHGVFFTLGRVNATPIKHTPLHLSLYLLNTSFPIWIVS